MWIRLIPFISHVSTQFIRIERQKMGGEANLCNISENIDCKFQSQANDLEISFPHRQGCLKLCIMYKHVFCIFSQLIKAMTEYMTANSVNNIHTIRY